MRYRQPGTKWCHVTLCTYRRRKIFKIAATARFCERLLRRVCEERGWHPGAIAVRPDVVQVLLEVPRATARDAVVRHLKRAAAAAVRDGLVCATGRRVFETGHWFAVLPSAAGVEVVRSRLERQGRDAWLPPPAQ
jgi:REP element-mobilizing transposase RayT